MKKVALAGLMFLAACGRSGPPTQETDIAFEAARAIATDETFPGLVSAGDGALVMSRFTMASPNALFYRSTDEGASWTRVGEIGPLATAGLGGLGTWGYDLIESGGALYFVWVAFDQEKGQPVFFSKSTDGGKAWTAPVMLRTGPRGNAGDPVVAADGDTVCVAWSDHRHDPQIRLHSAVYAASSSDGGATWSSERRLDDLPAGVQSGGALSVALAAAEGRIFCVMSGLWRHGNGKPAGTLGVATSTDSGKTWSIQLSNPGLPSGVSALASSKTLHVAAIRLTGTPITLTNPQNRGQVFYLESTDGGEDWTERRVDDDTEEKRVNKIRPRLAMAGSRRVIAWVEPDGVMASTSADGGKTWTRNVRLLEKTDANSTSIGLAVREDKVFLAAGRMGGEREILFVRGGRGR